MKVVFDENTFGITQKSLKMLRNALAESIHHSTAVIEVPTSDMTCGFLIVDRDANEAVWSGDGFRTDNGGEGGAGYKSALALLRLFGFSPSIEVVVSEPVDVNLFYTSSEKATARIEKWVDEAIKSGAISFKVTADTFPQYLR